jgi:transposase-like protein
MSFLSEKEAQVASILIDSRDVATVAEEHGVSAGTVRNVKMLKTKIARRVYELLLARHYTVCLLNAQRRFTPAEIHAIRLSKEPSTKTAQRYGVSPSTIRMIRTEKTYVD